MTGPELVAPAPAEPVTEELPPRPAPPAPRAWAAPHRHAGPLESLQSLLYVMVMSLFVITFIVQPIRIPSESMEPTLLVGDFLLMDKQAITGKAFGVMPAAELRRGEIIVFHEPVDDPAVHLVKRVIGVPGDRIHLRDGAVYRNGQRLQERYAVYRKTAADPYRDNFPSLQMMDARVNPNWWIRLRALARDGEVTVPPRSYFVMGDNRNDSEDSRYWGFVPQDAVVGSPLMIYFSVRQGQQEDDAQPGLPRADTEPSRLNFGRWDRMFRIVR